MQCIDINQYNIITFFRVQQAGKKLSAKNHLKAVTWIDFNTKQASLSK